jgi:hypothetical protein
MARILAPVRNSGSAGFVCDWSAIDLADQIDQGGEKREILKLERGQAAASRADPVVFRKAAAMTDFHNRAILPEAVSRNMTD